jgi:hypothetical protein
MTDDLQPLLSLLDGEPNPDYWSDVLRPRARAALDAVAGDLSALATHARSQPPTWRIRLAEAAMLAEHPGATDLLIDLLTGAEPEVGVAVTEALIERGYVWSPEVSLRADLERHLAGASDAGRPVIERLLRRLPT